MNSRIAILGAGPAGLTLAGLLHRSSVKCVIFEKEESASWALGRSGSGTLDLHSDSGLLALRQLGLIDRFNALARHRVPFRIADSQGDVHLNLDGDEDKPEIDRKDLRTLLLSAVPADMVRWGSKVQHLQRTPTSVLSIHFANGDVESGYDLIVGADGAWSKARDIVTPDKPVYKGVMSITGWLRANNPQYATAETIAHDGLSIALGDNKGIVIAKLREEMYQVGAMLRLPEDWKSERGGILDDSQALQKELSKRYASWNSSLINIVGHMEGPFHTWPQYSLPAEALPWDHIPGITLIGDAAHLSVSGGHGVNSAMFDAYQLAKCIAENGTDELDNVVRSFEGEMLDRTRTSLKEANNNLQHMISPDAPASWIKALMGESDD